MAALTKRLFGGRFDIEGEAGAGGAGTVYRARDTESGERVALKVLRAPMDMGADRFSREAQALAMLRHPSVVRYVSHGVTEELEPFLVMEWLEGKDLRRHLGEERLTVAQTVTLGARVAEALVAVHQLGVRHRDVKPSNIFLVGGRVAEVKLIDFGLVRIEDVSRSLTRSGVAVGTPGYMAPEQARGAREADRRADLFSLGCVLFKCLVGRAPFEGNHLVAVLTKVLLAEAPRVKSLRPEVPDALDALIARMLEKDPERRPSAATEVAVALGALEARALDPDAEPSSAIAASFSGLTESEQRIAAVLLFAPERSSAPGAARAGEIEGLVARFGVHLERLADGTRVATLPRSQGALDQASRLGRLALALRALLPGAPMALATGWSVSSGQALTGEAIDRAARLLALSAAPAPIAVDEVTAALLDARFEVTGRRESHPLGALEEGGGARLTGFRDAAIVGRTLLGKATPCVGREWELSTFTSQLHSCIEESRPVALVFTAPAGMGKSRLAVEAAAAARRAHPDLDVWIGRGDATREGSALGLLAQVLRSACDLREHEPPWEQRRKLAERESVRGRARVTEFLGEILGLPFPDDGRPALRAARADAQLAGEQMRLAFLEFLAAECAARPVLVVLDDLQWSDVPSIRFLDAALSGLEQARCMVLAFARPEVDDHFPRVWAGRNVQRLRLTPLSRKSTERLARLSLGPDADAAVIARVVDLAEGNVFFLEELIRAVAASGEGVGHDGGDSRTAVPSGQGSLPLPQTVLGMVQARLDAIDPGARRLLRAASVFGEAFWPSGVMALLGPASTPEEDWVEDLAAAELLVRRPESRFAGEPELVFRHALLREGAYATLTERDRAGGHRRAGAWLEERGERDPMVLARHLELGGDAARAAVLYLRGAEQALRASDLEEVTVRVDRAVALGLPEPARLHALGIRCEALTWQNDWEAAAATAEKVLAACTPGSAPWARATVARHGYSLLRGKGEEFMAEMGLLWTIEPEPDAIGAVLYVLHSAVFNLCARGLFTLARRLLARVDELAERLPRVAESGPEAPSPPAGALLQVGLPAAPHPGPLTGILARPAVDATAEGRVHMCHQCVDTLGSRHPERGLRHAEAARESYRRAGDVGYVGWAQLFIGIACWQLGAFERARLEMASVPVVGPRAMLTASTRLTFEGQMLVDAGALDEARAVAEQARRHDPSQMPALTQIRQGQAGWVLAEIAFSTGDFGAAERDVRMVLLRLKTQPLLLLSARVLLAAVLLAQGRGAEALVELRDPLASLESEGGRGFRVARTRLVAVEALAAVGDREEARRALALSRADLHARARAIADVDLRRSFLERVPENARTLALAGEWLD